MKKRSLVESFNYAIEGLIHTLKTQRNMRIHFAFGIGVIILGIYLNLDRVDLMLLLSAITFVFVAEMLNTSIELSVDIFTKEFHHLAKMAKDIAAACVFIAVIYAVIVGYLVFFKSPEMFKLSDGLLKIRQSPWHITFITLILIFALVITLKVVFHKGAPLRGGMPSGHAAFGFSIWTATVFLTNNVIIVILVFIMALLLARSRIRKGLHNVWEVIVGSVIGVLITTLAFQLLSR
ncbi:MAG: diacylglycerol kinase [Omnitrophica WOR_2 bacterium SM23_29]|nr:MAG: diacylglycerol kinase [Omnitrophica WOR_2 bacterium SM23_29]